MDTDNLRQVTRWEAEAYLVGKWSRWKDLRKIFRRTMSDIEAARLATKRVLAEVEEAHSFEREASAISSDEKSS